MADISNLSNYLKDLADALREKKGTQDQIPAADFDTEILSIQTGADTSLVTATVSDVKVGKKFLTTEGVLTTGSFPDISYQTETLTDSVELIQTNRTPNDIALTAYFDGKLFYWENNVLYCNLLDVSQSTYSINTTQTDVTWIDVGCKDIFLNNSVLVALSSNSLVSLYLYDGNTNTFSFVKNLEFKNGSTPVDYPTCTLAPFTPYLIVNCYVVGNSDGSIAKLYEISNTYDVTFKVNLEGNTASNRDIYRCFGGWFSDVFIKQLDYYNISMPDNLNMIAYDPYYTAYLKTDNTFYTRLNSLVGVDINNSYAIKVVWEHNRNNLYVYKLTKSGEDYTLGDMIYSIPATEVSEVVTSQITVNGEFLIIDDNNSLKVYKLGETIERVDVSMSNITLNVGIRYNSFITSGNRLYVLKSSGTEVITKMSYNNKDYIDTSDATAIAEDIVKDKTAYVNGEKLTGTYEASISKAEYDEAISDLNYILDSTIPYTKLSYIDTSGTQYVKLNLNAFENMRLDFKFQFLQSNGTSYNCALGGRYYTYNKNFGIFLQPNNIDGEFVYSLSENNEVVDTNVSILDSIDVFGTDIEIKIDNDQISVNLKNSSFIENVLCPVESNPDYPIYLFGMNERNNSCVDKSYMRFYELEVYNGDTLWRHYIPILDESEVPCIYEVVTGTKLYNSGTGSFIAGGVV